MKKETTDKRKASAEDIFKDSFIRLLKIKSFHKITITDITKESGLSRTTFYNYYADPYEILEQITDDIILEFYNSSEVKNKNYLEPFSEKSPITLFKFASVHSEVLQVLLKSEIQHILVSKWKSVMISKILIEPEKYLPHGIDKKHAELWLTFWFNGVWALITTMVLDSDETYSINEYENMLNFAHKIFH